MDMNPYIAGACYIILCACGYGLWLCRKDDTPPPTDELGRTKARNPKGK